MRKAWVAAVAALFVALTMWSPAGAAAPDPVTEARHQLDRYFAHHPIHNRDGQKSLSFCPIGSLPHAERALESLTGKKLPTGRDREYTQYDYSSGPPPRDQEIDCNDDIHPVVGKNNPLIDIDAARLYSAPHLGSPPHLRTVNFDGGKLHFLVSKRKGSPRFCGATWLPADQSYWVIVDYSSWKTPPTWSSCETYGKRMVKYVIRSIDIMKTA